MDDLPTSKIFNRGAQPIVNIRIFRPAYLNSESARNLPMQLDCFLSSPSTTLTVCFFLLSNPHLQFSLLPHYNNELNDPRPMLSFRRVPVAGSVKFSTQACHLDSKEGVGDPIRLLRYHMLMACFHILTAI